MFATVKKQLEENQGITLTVSDILHELTGVDKKDINIIQENDRVVPQDLYSLGLLLGYKFQPYVKDLMLVNLPGEKDKVIYFNNTNNFGICNKEDYNNTLPE